jgi:hypothetical protein
MNRKALITAVTLLTITMLSTPLVSAKPVVWSVAFELQTLPDLSEDADWSKYKEVVTKSGPVLVDQIPTIGTVVLEYNDGVSDHTMTGVVKQTVLTSKLYLFDDPLKVFGNEKWTLIFDGGTLEVSANFWIDDMLNPPNGGGTCVGTHGTGVFDGAIFKGTFDTIMVPTGSGGIFKIQSGSGEIKLP